MAEEKVSCAVPASIVDGTAKEEAAPAAEAKKEAVRMGVTVGMKAPDFTAPAYYKGKFTTVKLSDFAGKWVSICFYPGDFTFVWATEVSAVADRYAEFQALGVEVISISVDSQFVHKVWNDMELSKMVEGGVPFHMASDGGGAIGTVYGVYSPAQGVDFRGRFLIDPDGIIQGMEILTPPVGRNVDETLRQLKAFQHVRKTGGKEVTPSGWTPGGKVLNPAPDLVANVWKFWNPKDVYGKK